MVEFRLLGTVNLESAKGREARRLIGQPRRLALLAYLAAATPRGIQRRDRLLTLFWPELDQGRARAALRQALHVLREELGARVLVSRGDEEVGLDFDVVRCDVAEFDCAVAAGRMTEALDLYRGELLEGFFISGAPEFERWQDDERRRLRETASRAAQALVEEAEDGGDLATAVNWARRALRLAPHDEAQLRRLLTLLDQQGDRAGALRAYDDFARRLAAEFEAQPAAETQALLGAIRARATAAAQAMPRSEIQTVLTPRRHTVGRARERAALLASFESAVAGHGQVACVAGEPGIGKTTLVEDCLAELSSGGPPCHIARGRCSERLAGTAAYLPLLEALQSLLHGVAAESIGRLMMRTAPTWHSQFAPPSRSSGVPAPDVAAAPAASQARLTLELATFLEQVSQAAPLVLFFDDVHWIDPSTVDLLAYLGSRIASLRLLIVLAYRPAEMLVGKNVFWPMKLDLQTRGVCREIGLEFLTQDEVAQYLALEFPGHRFSAAFPVLVHARTEGSPLFMVDLLRYLRDHGAIVEVAGAWALSESLPNIERELPESVRSMIERQVGQLAPMDRRLLAVASVQGQEFDSAVVATVLAQDPARVEERLERLERVHALIRSVAQRKRPGRLQSVRYRFIHGLYQNALYASLTPTRRTALSAAVAKGLLAFHDDDSSVVASELALLYESARDAEQSARYFLLAAENAVRLFAGQEAAALARRGLDLITALPTTPERSRLELALQITLSVTLTATKGWGAREVETAWVRARTLCDHVGETSQMFRILAGLWRLNLVHARLRTAREMAEELLRLAISLKDPALEVEAHHAIAYPLNHAGEHVAAHEHATRGLALYDPRHFRANSLLLTQDPGVECYLQSARALWVLGYANQSMEATQQSFALARTLGQPNNLVWAHVAAGIMYQLLREVARSLEEWDEAIRLSAEHGLAQLLVWAKPWHGWTQVKLGRRAEGIAEIREGLATLQAMGTEITRPQCSALLAESVAEDGRVEEGLAIIAETLAMVERTGAGYYEAELHRLNGELLLMQGEGTRQREAEASFQRAIELAHLRLAKSFELRAATSLYRLFKGQRRDGEARRCLEQTYSWFTEGFETADLRDARELLQQSY
ncbi:MAG TPA: AAA family ATPase [Gemmatimonadales bacterium]|nr:AAA family ATPase [Gemmatimonadales bacterium]